MINLKDATFIIPFNKDSDSRLRNLKYVVQYILDTYDTNLIVAEQDTDYIREAVPKQDNVKRRIVKNCPVFHKTKLLNIMVKEVSTPYIIQYDTDVIMPSDQIAAAIESLKTNHCDVIFPYDGKFYEVLEEHHEELLRDHKVPIEKMHLVHPMSPGGALCWRKTDLIDIGWYNEHFTLWGFEDDEVILRAQKLGKRLMRTFGHVYHFNHARLKTNSPQCESYNNNVREFQLIQSLNAEQLKDYINQWSWK